MACREFRQAYLNGRPEKYHTIPANIIHTCHMDCHVKFHPFEILWVVV